jgi:hypothetical protein
MSAFKTTALVIHEEPGSRKQEREHGFEKEKPGAMWAQPPLGLRLDAGAHQ